MLFGEVNGELFELLYRERRFETLLIKNGESREFLTSSVSLKRRLAEDPRSSNVNIELDLTIGLLK